jgi:hypothetical protein
MKTIAIYIESHTKAINTTQNAESLIVTAAGTYSYQWALKG